MVEPDVLEENFSSIYLLRRDLKQRCHDTNKNTYALIFSLIVLNISYVNKFICCMVPLHKFGFSLYITFLTDYIAPHIFKEVLSIVKIYIH